MKLLRVMCYALGGTEMKIGNAIEYDGHLWLVLEWLEAPLEGWKQPGRSLRLTELQVQPALPHADLLIRFPLPKAVFDPPSGQPLPVGFVFADRLDIRVPIPPGIH